MAQIHLNLLTQTLVYILNNLFKYSHSDIIILYEMKTPTNAYAIRSALK